MRHSFSHGAPDMKALILSAGQGRRLLPWTESTPKCLLELGPRTVLEWQVEALLQAGVEEIGVISGYGVAQVERALGTFSGRCATRLIFNPFYELADNLASCWMAREFMDGPFVLANGDTLFEPAIAEQLLATASAPITLTTDRKDSYDADDMKVTLSGAQVAAVGKTLPAGQVHAESIGLLHFDATGANLFAATLERCMRDTEALKRWYLSVISELAAEGAVRECCIAGSEWAEIDYPADLEHARTMVGGWHWADPVSYTHLTLPTKRIV